MYGDTCFKCSGSGKCYTKRGAVAKEYFEDLLSIEAKDLQVGQQYWANGCWRTVMALEIGPGSSGRMVDGVFVGHTMVKITTQKVNAQVFPTNKLHIRPTQEALALAKEKALAYQDSLTKLGKPRKVKCTAP